jgi:hypothetical protein
MLEIPNSQHMSLDPVWNAEDRARYATLLAKSAAKADPALIQCAVWKRKVPGLTYDSNIESQLTAAALS